MSPLASRAAIKSSASAGAATAAAAAESRKASCLSSPC